MVMARKTSNLPFSQKKKKKKIPVTSRNYLLSPKKRNELDFRKEEITALIY